MYGVSCDLRAGSQVWPPLRIFTLYKRPDYGTRTLYIFVLMDEDLVYRVTLNLLCKY